MVSSAPAAIGPATPAASTFVVSSSPGIAVAVALGLAVGRGGVIVQYMIAHEFRAAIQTPRYEAICENAGGKTYELVSDLPGTKHCVILIKATLPDE